MKNLSPANIGQTASKKFKLLLLVLALVMVGCESPEDKVAGYVAAAEEFFEAEDLTKAELEVKNALQIQPKNAQANFLLAKISESRQNFPQMAASLRAAIESDPEFVEARVKLGTLYVLGGAVDEAKEQLDALNAAGVNTPLVKVFNARMQAVDGNLEGAQNLLEEALQEEPSNIQALGLLASITATEDLDSALDLIARGIAVTDNSRPLRLLRVQLLTRANRFDDVEQEYKALVAEFPDELAFGYQYARFLVQQGRTDEVEGVLTQIVERHPEKAEARLALAQFVAGTRGSEAAEGLLQRYVDEQPDMVELRNALAQTYQANGKLDEAYEQYQIISEQSGNADAGLTARAKMGGIHIIRGETEEGQELLNSILETDSMNGEALLLRGALYSEQGEFRDAVADFRNILRVTPDNRRAQLLLASAHAKAGDVLLAKDAYRRTLDSYPNDEIATFELARLLLADDDVDDAEDLLRGRLENAPNDDRAVRVLLTLLQETGRTDEALEEARQFAALDGKEALGNFLIGNVYLADENYASAADAFRSSLAVVPNAREPLQGLVIALVRDNKSAEAKQYLSDLSAENPDNLLVKTLLGQVLAGEGNESAAAEMLESTLQSDESWLPGYTALAGLQGDDVAAKIDIYKRGLEALPGSQELALLLGTAYERNGRTEDAIATYQNALASDPELPAVANNLAALFSGSPNRSG